MKMEQEAIAFKIAQISVPQSLARAVVHQIEYYFSLANLATDHLLRKLIDSNPRGWVKTSTILRFNKIRRIIDSAFDFTLTDKQRDSIVVQSLAESDRVKAVSGRIKFRKHFVWEREFLKVLYFEGQLLNEEELFNFFADFQISKDSIILQRGQRWFIAEFFTKTAEQMETLYHNLMANRQNHPNIQRILRMNQFFTYQKQMKEIIDSQKQPPKMSDLSVDQKMQPRKIYQYNDFVVEPIKQKKETIKSKPKKPKTPKQFSLPKGNLRSKNKKTRQQYEAIRAQKIQEWRQRKKQRNTSIYPRSEFEQLHIESEQI